MEQMTSNTALEKKKMATCYGAGYWPRLVERHVELYSGDRKFIFHIINSTQSVVAVLR